MCACKLGLASTGEHNASVEQDKSKRIHARLLDCLFNKREPTDVQAWRRWQTVAVPLARVLQIGHNTSTPSEAYRSSFPAKRIPHRWP